MTMDDLDEHRRMHPDAGDLPPELLSIAQRYAAQPSPRPTAERIAVRLGGGTAIEQSYASANAHRRSRDDRVCAMSGSAHD